MEARAGSGLDKRAGYLHRKCGRVRELCVRWVGGGRADASDPLSRVAGVPSRKPIGVFRKPAGELSYKLQTT